MNRVSAEPRNHPDELTDYNLFSSHSALVEALTARIFRETVS